MLLKLDKALYILIMQSIAPGAFILSTPVLHGSWFHNKIILVVEHSEQSSFGLVINHTANIPIDEVFRGYRAKDRKPYRFHFGGPVQEDLVQILEVGRSFFVDSPEVLPGVWLRTLADQEAIPILDLFANSTTRIVLGYSGWAAGQLQTEIDRGCWEVVHPDPLEILGLSRDHAIGTPDDFKREFSIS